MRPLLGIDFGTSHAAAALAIKDQIIPVSSADGRTAMPAVVGFSPSGSSLRPPLVGAEAVALAGRHPDRVIASVKRLLGRKFTAPEVRHQRQEAAYEIVQAKNGDARVRVGRRHLAPQDIAAYVLGELKAAAERMTGTPVVDAVVALPANFNDLQRQAIRDAARVAGFDVKGMLTEPAAAVLAAGMMPAEDREEHRVIVYDLGGGSFDVAALILEEKEARVVAMGGDAFLGGEDFDERIVDYLCDELVRGGTADPRQDRAALARLRRAAEHAKRELSSVPRVDVALGDARWLGPRGAPSEGGAATERRRGPGATGTRAAAIASGTTVALTRERLESLTQDLIDRTVWPTESVLRDAAWTVEDVDAVLLVGGQTRMPRLRAQITELFGRAIHEVADPEALVAIGAARQGAALFGRRRKQRWVGPVTESSCLSLGVETAGGVFLRLIPRGTPLPVERRQVFSTSADGQTQIVVHLLQGEREMAADNESVMKIQIGPLAPRPRGEPQIEVVLETDGSGLPRASAVDLATEQPRQVRVRASGGLTEAEIVAMSAGHAAGAAPGTEVVASQDLLADDPGMDTSVDTAVDGDDRPPTPPVSSG